MSLEHLLRDEQEALDFLLGEEFGMTLSTFIGPDGSTLLRQHDSDICECEECTVARWERIEREARRVVGDLRHIEATQYTRDILVKLPSK